MIRPTIPQGTRNKVILRQRGITNVKEGGREGRREGGGEEGGREGTKEGGRGS